MPFLKYYIQNHMTLIQSQNINSSKLSPAYIYLLVPFCNTHNIAQKILLNSMKNQPNPPLHKVDIFSTDLYQFTCSYSYFVSGKHTQQATFQVFFRKYPFKGQYTILGGIRAIKEFYQNVSLTKQQQNHLKDLFPHMDDQYLKWVRENIKSVNFKSFYEGQIVFANEPLISISGPLGIVQLYETPILNLVGFASLVATNASRMAKAVEPKMCIQFGIRRAQGPDGALSASQFAYLGGFPKTSNIHAAKSLNIPCVGTISHAYVTSFRSLEDASQFQLNGVKILERSLHYKQQLGFDTHEGQLASFIMYAHAYPDNFVALIDSYSTLSSGILNAIIVSKALVQAGKTSPGIRLDSGDLGLQSIKCRQIWDQHFPKGPRLRIIASDDLYEERLIQIEEKGSQIDVYAIGTNIATCKKQPALGLVCKLVELQGQPKMKFSQDPGKATYPGRKIVYRVWKDSINTASFDLIALEDEGNLQQLKPPFKVYNIKDSSSPINIESLKSIKMLNHSWDKINHHQTIEQSRKHYLSSKSSFYDVFDLKNPKPHQVYVTETYLETFNKTFEKLSSQKQGYGEKN